jgi:hypothetical protein
MFKLLQNVQKESNNKIFPGKIQLMNIKGKIHKKASGNFRISQKSFTKTQSTVKRVDISLRNRTDMFSSITSLHFKKLRMQKYDNKDDQIVESKY